MPGLLAPGYLVQRSRALPPGIANSLTPGSQTLSFLIGLPNLNLARDA